MAAVALTETTADVEKKAPGLGPTVQMGVRTIVYKMARSDGMNAHDAYIMGAQVAGYKISRPFSVLL